LFLLTLPALAPGKGEIELAMRRLAGHLRIWPRILSQRLWPGRRWLRRRAYTAI